MASVIFNKDGVSLIGQVDSMGNQQLHLKVKNALRVYPVNEMLVMLKDMGDAAYDWSNRKAFRDANV